jgi:hypothetical protein
MAYNTKPIITDVDRKPVPQYYNPKTDSYEVIQGRDGANSFIEKGRIVKDAWSGSTDITKNYASPMFGFGIVNDGTGDLTVTIGSISFTVKPGETFDDLFEGFTQIQITGNSAYRAVVRE